MSKLSKLEQEILLMEQLIKEHGEEAFYEQPPVDTEPDTDGLSMSAFDYIYDDIY
jgi:hypothetical protein